MRCDEMGTGIDCCSQSQDKVMPDVDKFDRYKDPQSVHPLQMRPCTRGTVSRTVFLLMRRSSWLTSRFVIVLSPLAVVVVVVAAALELLKTKPRGERGREG